MDLPIWFGINDFYSLLATVNFGIIAWIIVTIIRVKMSIKFGIKRRILLFKNWLSKRKELKEIKKLEGV